MKIEIQQNFLATLTAELDDFFVRSKTAAIQITLDRVCPALGFNPKAIAVQDTAFELDTKTETSTIAFVIEHPLDNRGKITFVITARKILED